MDTRSPSACSPSLAKYLRRARLAAELSQREAARATGVSAPYISQLERGRRTPPSREVLRKLAAGYGLEEAVLLREAGIEPDPLADLPEERLDWAFDAMCRDPHFRFGRRVRHLNLHPDVKAFLLEVYAGSTGRLLLTQGEAEEIALAMERQGRRTE